MRFLLRPGWIALTLAVAAFAFACYYLLAPWQFHRGDERDSVNAALARGVATAPVPRSDLVAPGTAPPAEAAWRQVVVTGTYRPEGEVLVRLRSVDGHPAMEVMTPLTTTAGETVLVDRGYVRTDSAGTLPPIPPPPGGTVTVTGYQRLDEGAPSRPMVVDDGRRQVYAANAAAVSEAGGVPASPGYLQLLPDQPGVITAVPLPPPDPNPSYSYAWQWLIFGLMAVGAWIYFARLEYRRARGLDPRPRRDDQDPRDAADGTPWDARPTSTEQKLADRYGRR
ncbi:SURF1 family protein [Actinomycetospora cinnamomea]|uniref:SURF1-like protein n=1 Tax=Actinomycetospora cinnamomea TaxID=663609 RepID=A0A2U1FA97_9PSEU|nr:SURF1 family cytochrome oxidase biogenesis protein [Actinomycetospora cinnamomea]PVZ09069.1 cytochrome oxidase assembly protein ShyY1 [Actinomycetospora cinnamomea]